MKLFDRRFGKKPRDPALAMIEWLKKQPPIARMIVPGPISASRKAAWVVQDWILSRPDCAKVTALAAFWSAMQNVPEEMAAKRSGASAPTPFMDRAKAIADGWRDDRFIDTEYGFDPVQNEMWKRFVRAVRKYRFKVADFDLPDGIRDPLPGPAFKLWWPTDESLKKEYENLASDIMVYDLAIEIPEHWLAIRKKRLGY